MARSAVRVVVWLAVVAAGTACTVPVAGTPSVVPGSITPGRALENPDRIAASDGLGDLTTWDPCSVVDPDSLRGVINRASFDVPESLDYCAISADTNGGKANLQVGWLFETSDLDLNEYKSQTRQGGLEVVSVGYQDGGCVRAVVFDDHVAMSVESYAWRDNSAVEKCAVADAVVDQVIELIVGGRATSFEFAPNSLGKVDPCAEVGADVVAKVAGLERSAEWSGASRHHCRWQPREDFPVMTIEFHIGRNPPGAGETIAGRDTHVLSEEIDDDEVEPYSVCTVTGDHIRFKHSSGEVLYELVSIHVLLPKGQAEAACTGAKAVAAELFPKLPNP